MVRQCRCAQHWAQRTIGAQISALGCQRGGLGRALE